MVSLLATLTIPVCSLAMEFKLFEEPAFYFEGYNFPRRTSIIARSSIEEGDTEKFIDVFKIAGRDQYGNITVYLDSDGGSVKEALKMVELMDVFEITAIVSDGDVCASACASILFVSVRIHKVEEGGLLAFHPCIVASVYPSDICGDTISTNALHHGTSYGAVMGYLSNNLAVRRFRVNDTRPSCIRRTKRSNKQPRGKTTGY